MTGIRCTRKIPCLVVLLAMWAGPREVGAQDAFLEVTEEDRVRARELFERGVEAGRRGELETGINYFAESFELFPHPGTLTNLGLFQFRADLRVEAYMTFRELMRRFQTVISETARAEVRQRMEELEAQLVMVTLESRPGADISVDGAEYGRSPLYDEVILEPGRHTFEASLEGYESVTRIQDLGAGERTRIELSLSASSGRSILRVDSPTEGALIRVDGSTPEQLPIERHLAPGEHELIVIAPGHESQVRRIELPESSQVYLTVDLSLASADSTEMDRPHWRRAWPWVIVGCALVSVAVTLGVVLSGDEPQPDWDMKVR